MSGHNKWAQIKRQKGAADAKRSKLFAILSRQITLEAKKAGGHRDHPALRKVIARAKAANMPNDNIDKAISKAAGGESGSLEEVVYEAYGPGGAALIITGITDNNNRTFQELKHLLSELGGNLATPGAAAWAFNKVEGEAGISWQAKALIPLAEDEKTKLQNLIDTLEEHEDINQIFTNIDLAN